MKSIRKLLALKKKESYRKIINDVVTTNKKKINVLIYVCWRGIISLELIFREVTGTFYDLKEERITMDRRKIKYISICDSRIVSTFRFRFWTVPRFLNQI